MGLGRIAIFLVFLVVIVVGLSMAFSGVKNDAPSAEVKATSTRNNLTKTLLWWKLDNLWSEGTSNTSSAPASSGNAGQNKQEPAKPKPAPPAGFSERDLSPLYREVRITGVSAPDPYSYAPARFLTLSAESGNKEPIFITGWKRRGNRGGDLFVPNGIAEMSPSAIGGAQSRIGLAPGEYAYFYTNESPIKRNFRLNKCTGFLNGFYAFTPPLPNDCPALYDRGEAATFTGGCQSFLYSLSSCAAVSPNDRNRFGSDSDAGCRDIMDRYNFGYCYNRFRYQSGFFSREWRVWMNERPNWDRQHDRILLFDNAGLLVDMYVY